ncbi:MAG: sulfotransferase [Deltaproteobacteria bacterium]|nr:sulfotransferase [Deltaproteobacteria bacterium]
MNGTNGENLIFLISQPRAGSTFFQLLLAGHHDIATTSEPWIALHPLYALREHGIKTVYNHDLSREALKDFLSQSGATEESYRRAVAGLLLSLYGQAAASKGRRFFLDKTPRYYFIVEELIRLFPGAKFLILIRNPLAVLNSLFNKWVGTNYALLGEFRHDLVEAPRLLAGAVRANPGRCLMVKYEDLAADARGTLGTVCAHLGIAFEEVMLDYAGRVDPSWRFGDGIGARGTDRPRGEPDGWRKGLAAPQSRLLARSYLKELGPELVTEMGYDFNDMEAALEPVEPPEAQGLISWATLMSAPGGFSISNEARQLVIDILNDEALWTEGGGETGGGERAEWREVVRSASRRLMDNRVAGLQEAIRAVSADREELKGKVERLGAVREELKAEVQRLGADRDRRAVEGARLRVDRDELKGKVERLGAVREELKAEVQRLRWFTVESARLRARVNALQGEAARLKSERDIASAEGKRLKAANDAILASRAWRATVWFRAAVLKCLGM